MGDNATRFASSSAKRTDLKYSVGFALPTVLIASIIMLTVLIVSVTSTVAVRNSLQAQHYNQMARSAADAGLAYAKACLRTNNNVPQWSDAKPLTPATDCNGDIIGSSVDVQVLVVAGGGGGGGNCTTCGGAGGGGAGGLIEDSSSVSVGSFPVVVGNGGSGGNGGGSRTDGNDGGNSTFGGLVAVGGGGGGNQSGLPGHDGGSGGGGSSGSSPPAGAGGSGTSGQGHSGGTGVSGGGGGGGGGGAGNAGANGGSRAGGDGITSSITGTAVYYSGGGGGGSYGTASPGVGGNGGGGDGANQSVNGGNGYSGTANTGGGGGGANGSNKGGAGGNGGSGVVIVSYPTNSLTATGGSVTTANGNTIHKFNSSGNFVVSNIATPSCPEDPICSVMQSSNVRTSFSVPKPNVNDDGVAVSMRANGSLDILRSSNNAVWRSYSKDVFESLVGVPGGSYEKAPKAGQTNFAPAYGYTGIQPGSCPEGFVPIPGSTLYDKPYGFCAMKYEAKKGSGNIPVSAPGGAPWVDISQSATIVSQGKSSPSSILTDLSTATSPYYSQTAGLKSATVDLGELKQVNNVSVWHYWSDYRTYHQTKTEVSEDNINWYTVFDSVVDGEYRETPDGKVHRFATRPVRYIRDWLDGSTSNTGNHWIEIMATSPTDSALDKSTAACTDCHLMTLNEYLAIAHNVLIQNNNWSGGSVGSGYIYSGHNDGSPNSALAASLTGDSDGYSGTGQSSGSQRRTLSLSNGEVIWDLAGNVAEWLQEQALSDQPGSSGYSYREWNTIGNPGFLPESLIPSNVNPAASGWTESNGIGSLLSDSDMNELKAIWYGGYWTTGSEAGIFNMAMDASTYETTPRRGFRVTL